MKWYVSSQQLGWLAELQRNVFYTNDRGRGLFWPTYQSGWGFDVITLDLVNVMKNDRVIRLPLSTWTVYPGAGVCFHSPSYQNTGYFIQKFAPLANGVAPVVVMRS